MIDSLTGQGINIEHACRTLSVSVSGYYAWKDRPDPPRTLRRIWLASEIVDVHKASGGTYGVRRVTAELTFRSRHRGQPTARSNRSCASSGSGALPNRRLPKGARLAQVTSLDLVRRSVRARSPERAVADRHHRAPHQRGEGVLLRGARHVLPAGGRLGDRYQARRRSWSSTRSGWPPSAARTATGCDPLRSRDAIHLLGVQRSAPRPPGSHRRWERSGPPQTTR